MLRDLLGLYKEDKTVLYDTSRYLRKIRKHKDSSVLFIADLIISGLLLIKVWREKMASAATESPENILKMQKEGYNWALLKYERDKFGNNIAVVFNKANSSDIVERLLKRDGVAILTTYVEISDLPKLGILVGFSPKKLPKIKGGFYVT